MAKKSKKRTDDGPGIYEICVDGRFAEYRSALNKADAVQGYLRDRPEDAGKKVEARKARPHPPGTSVDIDGLIKEMTRLRVLQGKLNCGEDITS